MTASPQDKTPPRFEFVINEGGITIRQVIVCPYWELLPPLSEAESEELGADIAKRGVVTPLIVVPNGDEWRALDGYHRASLAFEKGRTSVPLKQPDPDAYPKTPEEEEELAIVLNVKRRQLTPEARQRLALRLRQLGKSYREIGKILDVDHKTARADVQKAVGEFSPTELPDTIQGKDGKKYSSQKPAPQITEEEPEETSDLEASVNTALVHVDPKTLTPQATPKEEKARDSLESRAEYTQKVEENRRAKHATIARETKEAQAKGKLGPFSVILADCPWRHSAKISESRETKYPTLSISELCALDVPRIAAKNAVLYLWTTAPHAKEAFEVMEAWGFEYVSQLVWIKEGGSPGLGHYSRVNHELVYIGVRGDFPTPPLAARFSSVIKAKKGEHSEKPEELRVRLDRMYTQHPKVELFARKKAKGWTSLGNEIDGQDIRELLKKEFHGDASQWVDLIDRDVKPENPVTVTQEPMPPGAVKRSFNPPFGSASHPVWVDQEGNPIADSISDVHTENRDILPENVTWRDLVENAGIRELADLEDSLLSKHPTEEEAIRDAIAERFADLWEEEEKKQPTMKEAFQQSAKKRGKKEKTFACISCQKETSFLTARNLQNRLSCPACFEKFPPSFLCSVRAKLQEGAEPFTRFGFSFTPQETIYEGVTARECVALHHDRRLVAVRTAHTQGPLAAYEAPDYYLSMIEDAKTEQDLDHALRISDAYLPDEGDMRRHIRSEVARAAGRRREQLRKKVEKEKEAKKAAAKKKARGK